MSVFSYSAAELFDWLSRGDDILVLDVRNPEDFERFHVEAPKSFNMINISYYDFMEAEDDSVAKVPKGHAIRIVCAKEGSAKYVAEILAKHGFMDVGYLKGGIKTWGNLLVPKLVNPGMDFSIYQFIRPGKASCSYGIIYRDEMMVFDPSRAVDFYIDFADKLGCVIRKTFETHLQADYISGSRQIARKTGAEFLANERDFGTSKQEFTPLADGEIHRFHGGGPEIRVLFTPGHTPGSTSFIVNDKFMISGDTVFITSIGRPDLGGKADEWSGMLFDSINMIRELDPDLVVLPAHYMSWEEAGDDLIFAKPLGEIIEINRDIYGIPTLEEFRAFIKANMRPQPPEYALIRLANANLEQFDPEKQEELDLGKNECAASAYAARAEQNS